MERIDSRIKVLQHNEPVSGVRFTPDGTRLVSIVNTKDSGSLTGETTINVWDAKTWEMSGFIKVKGYQAWPGNFQVTEKNQIIFKGKGIDLEELLVVDLDLGGESSQKVMIKYPVLSYFALNDFSLVATGCLNGDIRFWQLLPKGDFQESYRIVRKYGQPSQGAVNTINLATFGDREYLMVGTWQGAIKIWSMDEINNVMDYLRETNSEEKNMAISPYSSFGKPGDSVSKLLQIPDDNTFKVLSCSADHLRVWRFGNIKDYPFDYSVRSRFCSNIDAITLIPSKLNERAVIGKGVYLGMGNVLELWDLDTLEMIAVFDGHRKGVRSVDVSPDGKLIASASADGTVIIWETPRL